MNTCTTPITTQIMIALAAIKIHNSQSLHLDPAPQVAYNTSRIGLMARRTVWAAATVYDRLLLLQKTRQCEVNIGSHKCFGAIRQESPQQFSMGQRAK